MKHLGDITKIDGAKAPAVEVVIGGSPCQDLSVAGKRAGLAGERSGLFMEQIRIIKEMRRESERSGADVIIPRFMVWENVPGAFSSNKGEDFRIVLEETARVVKPTAVIPRPEKGKWTNAGAIVGDGWSVAWRVFDAQFWGVPQRRRRIALIADFGGATAPEILFERKGLFGDITQSGTPWKDFASVIAKRFGGANQTERESGHLPKYGTGGGNTPLVYDARGNGEGGTVPTITGDHQNRVTDYTAIVAGFKAGAGAKARSIGYKKEVAPTLDAMNHNTADVIALDRAAFNQGKNAQYDFKVDDEGVNSTIVSKGPSAVCYGICSYDSNAMKSNNPNSGIYEAETTRTIDGNGGNPSCNQGGVAICQSTVRRLTPLECERLQGFPDGWTDIGDYTDTNGKKRKASDSARYKALGNSIALPPWAWILERLNSYCTVHTMASLFDGIGGFPLIWETLNGDGSCVWASEIEEFPIAVTKKHFLKEHKDGK